MLDTSNPYATFGRSDVVALSAESERTAFIRRTYTHLALAIAAFVGLETLLIQVIPPEAISGMLRGRWTWLLVLGAFMGVSWLAQAWANSAASRGLQYAGLGLYVLAEAAIFLPIMSFATMLDASIPINAGLITLVVFGGLTMMVFVTRADFSWLGRFLWLAGLAAMGAILCSLFFQQSSLFGVGFSFAMVGLAAGYILYDTSNVMHHYRTDQHVAASLALFASVALLLWYVVRILLAFRSE